MCIFYNKNPNPPPLSARKLAQLLSNCTFLSVYNIRKQKQSLDLIHLKCILYNQNPKPPLCPNI